MSATVQERRTTPPLTPQYFLKIASLLAGLVAVWWAWNRLNMSVLSFFDDLQNVVNLFKRMSPPDFAETDRIISLTFETLWIALLGTFGAVILSYPLAIGAAANTTTHPTIRFVCRSVITLSRAVPELILAAIFVVAYGPGPSAGIVALALHSIGMIGRLFSDAIEEASEASSEAVTSVGATRRQRIRSAVIPQALPSFIATALFRLEINIRGSAVLGLVGAGGIGGLISESLETIQYKPALAAVIVVFFVILIVELVSTSIRQSLIGEAATQQQNKQRGWLSSFINRRDALLNKTAYEKRAISAPWTTERLFRASAFVFFVALLVFAITTVNIEWGNAIQSTPKIGTILGQMFPPSAGGEYSLMIKGLVESLAIAIVSTFLGVAVALPLAVLMARNINVRRSLSFGTRIGVLGLRGIPELIIAVIFVSAMGLGPVPGTLALSVTVAVFASKLFADSLEEINPAPREGVAAVGASKVQEFFSAVVPQFISPFVSNFFYLLDVFFRSSTVLGIVGGGGIGFLLISSIRVYQFKLTMAIVLSVYLIVLVIEWLGIGMRRLFK
ncbi:MAG: phosphonate ABC transporter, permease protein PhnE [Ilumatobacteraceae bacterium]|nr:phosphonate ABC transporter, permease protein PhnE [Ilumatobacteraceae bacterium]